MIHLKDGLNTLFETTCVKIYDPELKKLIGVYPNYVKAGAAFGISGNSVQQRCKRKTRVFSPIYNKEIACRLATRTKVEEELINQSKIKFLE